MSVIVSGFTETSNNCISLRTAIFHDNGSIASLTFQPKVPNQEGSFVWVYKRNISHECLVEYDVKKFDYPRQNMLDKVWPNRPEISFLWSETGHAAAVCIEGIPWAYIVDYMKNGYSKSIYRSIIGGNPWNEELFQELFVA